MTTKGRAEKDLEGLIAQAVEAARLENRWFYQHGWLGAAIHQFRADLFVYAAHRLRAYGGDPVTVDELKRAGLELEKRIGRPYNRKGKIEDWDGFACEVYEAYRGYTRPAGE